AVQLVDRHAERLDLVAVEIDVELRHVRAPESVDEGELRLLAGAREELLQHLGGALRAALAVVLDIELESARRSQAENRRGGESEYQGFLDSRGLHEDLADQLRCRHGTVVPVFLRDEDR